MDIYEAIEKRRTIRAFIGGTTDETVRKIIRAGAMAMSAGNSQPWEFIILDDPALIKQIAEHKYRLNQTIHPEGVAKLQKKVYLKSSVVAACYKDDPGGNLWSMWSCIQNMALAATAEGLGIVPSTLWGGTPEGGGENSGSSGRLQTGDHGPHRIAERISMENHAQNNTATRIQLAASESIRKISLSITLDF